LFTLFLINRVLSGAAEAAASGADEALTYDSLKAAGQEGRWGQVLERVQRDTSIAFFFAMMLGAAVYDPEMVNAVLRFLGIAWSVEQVHLIKLPIMLTFISGLVVLTMAFRMHETRTQQRMGVWRTVRQSWQQTMAAAKWIWVTPLAFGIILSIMAVDSVVRQFLTLASEYWNVIDWPIATYGLIASCLSLMGVVVPRLARRMADHWSPLRNFLVTSALVMLGLLGLGLAIPYWGIVPAVFLYAAMYLASYLVSRYLNELAPSDQRATILSFKGLSTNVSYGLISVLYSGLVASLKLGGDGAEPESVFVASLQWFPIYFLIAFGLVFLVQRSRFGQSSRKAG